MIKKLTALLAAAAAAISLTISGFASELPPEEYTGYAEQAVFGGSLPEEYNSSEIVVVNSFGGEMLSENTAGEAGGAVSDDSGFSAEEFVKKLLISLAVGVVIALIICFIMKSMMKTARSKRTANDYIRKNSFNITRSRDIFIYSNVTKKKRVREENKK